MRIVAKRTLRTYWERTPRAEQPLKAWYAIATRADWAKPADVKVTYGHASVVGSDRVVFNIGGNRYRLVVRFDYANRMGSYVSWERMQSMTRSMRQACRESSE